jgi:hypothetical protein
LPYGKGYAFWTRAVLTPACLDTEYFRKTQENVKNRTKCDTDLPIGKKGESNCLTKGTEDTFGNRRKISLADICSEFAAF